MRTTAVVEIDHHVGFLKPIEQSPRRRTFFLAYRYLPLGLSRGYSRNRVAIPKRSKRRAACVDLAQQRR